MRYARGEGEMSSVSTFQIASSTYKKLDYQEGFSYLRALSTQMYLEDCARPSCRRGAVRNGAREMSDAAGTANSYPPTPQDQFAAGLRGFGPVGILAVLVIAAGQIVAPLSALLVLVWTSLSRTPWREIGYVRPKSWIASLAAGIVFGILFKVLMKAIVMPLLGANPTNQAYHYLAGNAVALPAVVLTMIFVAGFGEETVFRGYMFERLGKLLGRSRAARIVTVLASAALFGSLHYFDQGLAVPSQQMWVNRGFSA
jgi:membrane protease YdiL (CAAX protease family)